jgi:hypothetical protein
MTHMGNLEICPKLGQFLSLISSSWVHQMLLQYRVSPFGRIIFKSMKNKLDQFHSYSRLHCNISQIINKLYLLSSKKWIKVIKTDQNRSKQIKTDETLKNEFLTNELSNQNIIVEIVIIFVTRMVLNDRNFLYQIKSHQFGSK